MNKIYKRLFKLFFIIVVLLLLCVCVFVVLENEKRSKAMDTTMRSYEEFLNGERAAHDCSNQAIYCDSNFKKTDGSVLCTFVDMTGDGISELHVIGRVEYLIITLRDSNLTVWYRGTAYERLLNNHAILYSRSGTGMDYKYIELSKTGGIHETVFSVVNVSEETTSYYFNGEAVSELEYKEKTAPYLSIKTDKINWLYVK